MALPIVFLLIVSSFSCIPSSFSHPHHQKQNQSQHGLSLDYYAKTCPRFNDILREQAQKKQSENPTTAAGILRVFFHDCMVDGCDASVLIRPTAFNHPEMENDINHSLPGDAFDLIIRAKTALELECPGVVSCSDILAVAARNLITMTGGPHYKVVLGRKDGFVSNASHVEPNLGRSNMSVNQMLTRFTSKGFNVQEMVALIGGGHTIGFSHCIEFSQRLFGPKTDATMNPKLVEALKKLCGNYTKDPTMSAFLDMMTPGVFDNKIFGNIKRGLAILASDQVLNGDPRTKPIVEKYAANNTLFFEDFAKAMEKVSVLGVKTGKQGEVRKRCDSVNA